MWTVASPSCAGRLGPMMADPSGVGPGEGRPDLQAQILSLLDGVAEPVAAGEVMAGGRSGLSGRRRVPSRRPRLVSLSVLALALVLLAGGLVLGLTRNSGRPTTPSSLGREPGSLPAVRIGLVALSFVDAEHGFGVYEPFNPGEPIPPPRIARTSDGGADWFIVGPAPAARPTDSPGRMHLVFQSRTVGFFWSGGPLWETTDGGGSWKIALRLGGALSVSVSGGSAWAEMSVCHPGSPVANSSCQQDVYRSTTPGSAWRFAWVFRTWRMVGPVAAVSATTAYIPINGTSLCQGPVCQGFGTLYVDATTDGGRRWDARILPCAGSFSGGGLRLSASPDGTLWLACYGPVADSSSGMAIYRSIDRGVKWQLESSYLGASKPPGVLASVGLAALIPTSADSAYALTPEDGGPRLFVTSNGGKTWSEPASDPYVAVDNGLLASAGPSNAWLAGFGEGTWATTDAGHHWALDPPVTAPYATDATVPQLAQLDQWAGKIVADQGKGNVTAVFVLETTADKSDEGGSFSPALLGVPVYVLWVEGSLTCPDCSGPGPAPRNSTPTNPTSRSPGIPAEETVIIRSTMQSNEFGTAPALPDLPAIGPTYRLQL
jgi:hypothetical protein